MCGKISGEKTRSGGHVEVFFGFEENVILFENLDIGDFAQNIRMKMMVVCNFSLA